MIRMKLSEVVDVPLLLKWRDTNTLMEFDICHFNVFTLLNIRSAIYSHVTIIIRVCRGVVT